MPVNNIQSSDELTTSETDTTLRLAPDGLGGVRWAVDMTAYTTSNISNPPTEAEIVLLLGQAFTRGAGYVALIKDSTTGTPLYLAVSDGSRWWYHALTEGEFHASSTLALTETGHRDATPPDIYTAGIALGELDSSSSGLEFVMASGATLASPPYLGHIRAFKADGSVLWTFTSPSSQYGMLVDIGDVNGDGYNEVGATFNITDSAMYLLDRAGTEIWHYNMVGGGYARAVKIGKVRNDYANNQIVVGGENGQFVLLDENGAEIWRKSLAGSYTVQDAVIADTDIDGTNEIIIIYDEYVRKYDNTGTQIWSKTLGDVHNDVLGLAVGNVTSATGLEIAVAVLPRFGSGSVNKTYLLDKDGNELWNWTPPSGGVNMGCQAVMIADVNGDGQNEVIVGYGNTPENADPGAGNTGGVAILDSSGNLLGSTTFTQTVEFLIWGDIDNDGENEIITAGRDGQCHILRVIISHAQEITNIGRVTAYEDTITNVEAATGTLAEMSFARDTADGKLGIYIGGAWYWFNQTPTLFNDAEGNPEDVTSGVSADGTSAYAARRDHIHHVNSAGQVVAITRWSASLGQTIFILPDIAESILFFMTNGLAEDMLVYSLSADRTQIVLDTGLAAAAICEASYVVAQI